MTAAQASAEDIRLAFETNPKARERDLAAQLGVSEAQLVAARVGHGAVAIKAHPDHIMAAAETLGEVMALTRNESCVSEIVGTYGNYRSGEHAGMVLNGAIDLRMFPKWWVHAFAVEKQTERGLRRSIQVFDAAGDAVHKIHLREGSHLDAWEALKTDLALEAQSDTLDVAPRAPLEGAMIREDKVETLRDEWARMSDTHQFNRLCSKFKMNRLGAYRAVGAPFVRRLEIGAVDSALHALRDQSLRFMLFVGNRGCIQIFSGPIHRLQAMGPWQNVLDPGFDLHLRLDHIAEVYAVEKPTQRGTARSLEAFDDKGQLILQAFPMARDGDDTRPQWQDILTSLPSLQEEVA